MTDNVLGNLIAVCLFGGAGAFIGRRVRVPARSSTWLLLPVVGGAGAFIGRSTSVVCLFGVSVLLNWAIASCCLGLLVALMIRSSRAGSIRVGPADR